MNTILTKVNHFQPTFKQRIDMNTERVGNMSDLIKFVEFCHKNTKSWLETLDSIQIETTKGLYTYRIYQTYIKRFDQINSKFKYYRIS